MQLIIISGPTGSGKTTLSKIILKRLKNGIILNTDNYYRTGLISKLLSKTIKYYFDRKISFNYKLFKEDLEFILKTGYSIFKYKYNFKRKSIKKSFKKTTNIRFVIVEGIFGLEILKFYPSNKCIFISLKTNKKACMKRVIKRDFKERGKTKNHAEKDFKKAWELFYKNKQKNNSNSYLEKFIVRKESDINCLLKKISTIKN